MPGIRAWLEHQIRLVLAENKDCRLGELKDRHQLAVELASHLLKKAVEGLRPGIEEDR